MNDKVLHLLFGLAAAAGAAATVWLNTRFGLGPSLAFASTCVGAGNEVVQKLRRSGEPSWADAATTSAPGWVAWGTLWLI